MFSAIGLFLSDHRLSCDPVHYAFAHNVLSDSGGALARAVARLAEGGVRLTERDIADLGGKAVGGAPVPVGVLARGAKPSYSQNESRAEANDALIARTELQVRGLAETMRAIHEETSGFGRDLRASAEAMRAAGLGDRFDEVARLTGTMIERVHSAEFRLAAANREADELRRALEEARGSARRDPLTELANRRAFDEAFAALHPDTTVAIALCDIDHFKRVNDEFGHAVGDRVLRAVGRTLAAETEGCLVARYGGEEFALLMSGVDLQDALATVERACSAVSARRLRTRDSDTPIGTITISGGIALGVAGDGREPLYARADAALYRAKAAGRNRVFSAPDFGV